MDSLAIYYRWRSHHAQGKMAFHQAAERLSEVVSPTPGGQEGPVLARLWAWRSRMWGDEHDRDLLVRGLSLLEGSAADARPVKALILQQMGWLEGRNDPEKARAYCQESL
jgi:hypothetical protein